MKNRKKGRKKKEKKRKNGYGENMERDVEGDEGCIDVQFDCSEVLWDSGIVLGLLPMLPGL